MKKLFSVLLFVVLVVGLILSGCAAPTPAPAPAPAPTPAPAPAPAPAPTASAAPPTVIDVFCHVLPPKYMEALKAQLPKDYFFSTIFQAYPKLYDWDMRSKDMVPGYKQVISMMIPPIEAIADPQKAVELAKMANDGMAELVKEHPDTYIAAIGCLPMNNMDAALKEADRCINELGFKGIQIHTPVNDKPLDSPEFIPLYEKMANYGVPIWIHPWRAPDYPDYRTETTSKFLAFLMWGWDYEETIAMNRLAYSGILEKYPNLKFIVHHGGSMVPFLVRVAQTGQPGVMTLGNPNTYAELTKPAGAYYKMFYPDTSSMPDPAIIEVSAKFYGVDHMLFATDYPFALPSNVIKLVQEMNISDADKTKIFEGNAKKMLNLP
jgi:predicted TIM-barrel fold metal-dependent hydrolase